MNRNNGSSWIGKIENKSLSYVRGGIYPIKDKELHYLHSSCVYHNGRWQMTFGVFVVMDTGILL